jgi:hypothetical protein
MAHVVWASTHLRLSNTARGPRVPSFFSSKGQRETFEESVAASATAAPDSDIQHAESPLDLSPKRKPSPSVDTSVSASASKKPKPTPTSGSTITTAFPIAPSSKPAEPAELRKLKAKGTVQKQAKVTEEGVREWYSIGTTPI